MRMKNLSGEYSLIFFLVRRKGEGNSEGLPHFITKSAGRGEVGKILRILASRISWNRSMYG